MDVLNIKKAMVLIPAYNEAKNIENTIKELSKYFCNIVVVDDGSTDNTYKILKKYKVKIIHNLLNIGQGGALGLDFYYFELKNLTILLLLMLMNNIFKAAFEMLDLQ